MPGILPESRPRSPRNLAGASLPLTEHRAALQLVQVAPDAVPLADVERVLQAIRPDGAAVAEGLGSGLAGELLLTPLEVVGSEEQRGVLAATGGPELPSGAPVPPDRLGHRVPPAIGPSPMRFVSEGAEDWPKRPNGPAEWRKPVPERPGLVALLLLGLDAEDQAVDPADPDPGSGRDRAVGAPALPQRPLDEDRPLRSEL